MSNSTLSIKTVPHFESYVKELEYINDSTDMGCEKNLGCSQLFCQAFYCTTLSEGQWQRIYSAKIDLDILGQTVFGYKIFTIGNFCRLQLTKKPRSQKTLILINKQLPAQHKTVKLLFMQDTALHSVLWLAATPVPSATSLRNAFQHTSRKDAAPL